MSKRKKAMEIESALEFYEQWPNLKGRAEALSAGISESPDDAALLAWMIRVIDMVGPNDLESD